MNNLQVWHYPQIPCKPFIVEVVDLREAVKIMQVLGDYDLFQFDNKIKSDYSNATVLIKYNTETKIWEDWEVEYDGQWWNDPEEYLEAFNAEAVKVL